MVSGASSECIANAPKEERYSPKSAEEVDLIALVIGAEMEANRWNQREFICLSVNGLDPSPKLLKSLRQRKFRVRTSGEWARKFNCRFDVQLEYSGIDAGEDVNVQSTVGDLREINTGQSDLATLLRKGTYLLRKENATATWSINDYIPMR